MLSFFVATSGVVFSVCRFPGFPLRLLSLLAPGDGCGHCPSVAPPTSQVSQLSRHCLPCRWPLELVYIYLSSLPPAILFLCVTIISRVKYSVETQRIIVYYVTREVVRQAGKL